VVRKLYRGYCRREKPKRKKKPSLTSDRPCSMYSKTGALPSGCFQATKVLWWSESIVSVALKPGRWTNSKAIASGKLHQWSHDRPMPLSGERGEIIVLQTSLAAARQQGRNVSQNGLSVSQHSVHVLPVSSCKGKVQLAIDGRRRLHHETSFCCDR
jgi:hypothetical protein